MPDYCEYSQDALVGPNAVGRAAQPPEVVAFTSHGRPSGALRGPTGLEWRAAMIGCAVLLPGGTWEPREGTR